MSRSAAPRLRYGRVAVLAVSMGVVLVSGLANLGLMGSGGAAADELGRPASYAGPTRSAGGQGTQPQGDSLGPTPTGPQWAAADARTALPASSGTGRRVVFSQHLQRVWLVGSDDQVVRTYLVSGSRTDNLQPGTYAIERRERHATGIDDSGTMEYFDVFTAGPTGAAIGFHSVPVKDGHLVQTAAQLGTPQSHGCIRQWKPDAIALWRFAPLGTEVVVVA